MEEFSYVTLIIQTTSKKKRKREGEMLLAPILSLWRFYGLIGIVGAYLSTVVTCFLKLWSELL